MGIRSEVVVAVKADIIAEEMPEAVKQALTNLKPDQVATHAEGTAWKFDDIKWYPDYEDVKLIMKFLNSLDEEDYLFLDAVETAETEELGFWYENPWGLHIYRMVGIGGLE